MKYDDIITIQSERRFGKPCIRDTRISVYDVVSWLASGMTMHEILEDFPELTHEDILACLAFTESIPLGESLTPPHTHKKTGSPIKTIRFKINFY